LTGGRKCHKRGKEPLLTTRLYTHALCLEHLNLPGHPERPERLEAIETALQAPRFDRLDRMEAPAADPALFGFVHAEDYLAWVRDSIPDSGFTRLDPDTSASPKSWAAVERAVGAGISGLDAIFAGEIDNFFAAVRPPGHHAEKSTAMGFCLVNTIAVAARYAQRRHGVERVAIVDFDVHHGNGTQDIFWDDPNVLFASTHQMPLFPGTGALSETGAGNIFNAPLREGDDGYQFRLAFETRVLPAVDAFGPDLLLVSAGFDAHARDPLAGLNLMANDFDWATARLMELAERHASNRLGSFLEGGYDLVGLAESAAAHVNRLITG
jgi:acetoin utilization deacetylase AcuC-like enzyme